jgi:signal transduction histidine kinase
MKILNETYFKSKEQLIQVADLLPYPFIVAEIKIDSNINDLYFNENLVNEFGYTTNEIKDVDGWFLKVYPDENYRNEVRDNFSKELEIARENGDKFVKIKAKLTSKNKTEKWYEIKALFINDFFVFAFVDINNEVLLQEELKKTNRNNDRMLSILSHDLRSPIANLAFTSSLASDNDISNEEFKMVVKKINKESHQALEMLITTLDWARLNFNVIQKNALTVDYNVLINNLVDSKKSICEDKNIKVDIDLKNFRTTKNDPKIITIILKNLFSNAIKFTPNDGTISFFSDQKAIVVKDSGVGISPGKMENIMQNQYGSTRGTQKELGMGVGLQLVMRLAEKIGCKIVIQSQLQQGTTVRLVFEK